MSHAAITPTPAARIASVADLSGGWLAGQVPGSREKSYEPSEEGSSTDREYRYLRNCTSFGLGEVRHLTKMIDEAVEISYRTFCKHCSWREASELFGYDTHPKQGGLMLKNDWAVTYQRSTYKGKRCYVLCHSAIEYIFVHADFKGN
jgi:hypothetical protein